jgi:hypothetical protein
MHSNGGRVTQNMGPQYGKRRIAAQKDEGLINGFPGVQQFHPVTLGV